MNDREQMVKALVDAAIVVLIWPAGQHPLARCPVNFMR